MTMPSAAQNDFDSAPLRGLRADLALSTGRGLAPVDASIADSVRQQTRGERLQSELFFEALWRTL